MKSVKNTTQSEQIGSIEAVAHAWLMKWAKWARHGTGLGYPKRWVTERAREGGILAGSPRPPTVMPDEIAVIDEAVGKLRTINRSILARVILKTYLEDSPVDNKAKSMGISRSQYYQLLKRSQRRVFFWVDRIRSVDGIEIKLAG